MTPVLPQTGDTMTLEPKAPCEGEAHDHPAHDWRTACLNCGVFRGSDLRATPQTATPDGVKLVPVETKPFEIGIKGREDWIPVSRQTLARLGDHKVLREALGKLSPAACEEAGMSKEGANAVEALWSLLEADDFHVVIPAPPVSSAAPAPAEQGGIIRETGWLVEMQISNEPWWWAINLPNEENWTKDSLKALRFGRRDDAEAFITDSGWTEVFATEHEWSDRSALASPPAILPSGEATHYAVYSKSGMHVGLWTDKSVAEQTAAQTPGSSIISLVALPTPPTPTPESGT